jgi:predicted dinucleotide-binding enzyme
MTTIGIIGAGAIGQAFAKRLAAANIDAILSNSRGPDSLRDVVQAIGPSIKAGTVQQAAAAEIVFIAVNWSQLPAALAGLPDWNGRIVIDGNNPVIHPGFRLAELGGRSSSEVLADMLPGARLVKAFNTLPAAVLAQDPRTGGSNRVVFISGDDAAAKAEIKSLTERLGFASIDLGRLVVGAPLQQFPGGPLPGLNLLKIA